MKIKRGGGGIDKDGNVYKLPEDEIEVPYDHFRKFWQAVIDSSKHAYDPEPEKPR